MYHESNCQQWYRFLFIIFTAFKILNRNFLIYFFRFQRKAFSSNFTLYGVLNYLRILSDCWMLGFRVLVINLLHLYLPLDLLLYTCVDTNYTHKNLHIHLHMNLCNYFYIDCQKIRFLAPMKIMLERWTDLCCKDKTCQIEGRF